MSLRYRLNKEMFKGKKLPPKIRTNEDHISPDQRGSSGSDDQDPFSEHNVKQALKQSIENDMISRRGLFGTLDQLKDYADKSDQMETERKKPVKRRKINLKPPEDEELAENGETTAPDGEPAPPTGEATAEAAPESTLEELPAAEAPRRGFFRRVLDRFYPSIDDPEEAAARKREKEEARALKKAQAEAAAQAFAAQAAPDEKAATAEASAPGEHDAEGDENSVDLHRRNMMRQSLHFFAKPAVDKIQGKIDTVNKTVEKITKRIPLLRPPGAIEERAFLQACTRCDKCIHACPKDAIKRVPKKHGFLIMDTPFIDPVKVPCVMCTDLPCISACPDGALLPVPGGPSEVSMGYAILDRKRCQAYGDTFCQQCVIDCPVPGAIVQKDQKPVINRDACTGCGVCVRSCSTVNIPVAIKIKPQMVIDWQNRKKAMEEMEREMRAREEQEKLAKAREAVPSVAEGGAETDGQPDPESLSGE